MFPEIKESKFISKTIFHIIKSSKLHYKLIFALSCGTIRGFSWNRITVLGAVLCILGIAS